MNSWFLCTIKYDKVNETGKSVSVKETYLVDALSFTEAEARIIEEVKPFISGEFSVASVKRARISELFSDEEYDRWWRCKVVFYTPNEETGEVRRTVNTMLVQACNVREAVNTLLRGINIMADDYDILAVSETNIMDVYPYKAE